MNVVQLLAFHGARNINKKQEKNRVKKPNSNIANYLRCTSITRISAQSANRFTSKEVDSGFPS